MATPGSASASSASDDEYVFQHPHLSIESARESLRDSADALVKRATDNCVRLTRRERVSMLAHAAAKYEMLLDDDKQDWPVRGSAFPCSFPAAVSVCCGKPLCATSNRAAVPCCGHSPTTPPGHVASASVFISVC